MYLLEKEDVLEQAAFGQEVKVMLLFPPLHVGLSLSPSLSPNIFSYSLTSRSTPLSECLELASHVLTAISQECAAHHRVQRKSFLQLAIRAS